MTREDFTEVLKGYGKTIAPSTLSTWESTSTNAPLHDPTFVEAIAGVFNITVADVLAAAGFDLGPAYNELDETRRLLLEAYDNGSLDVMVRMALEAHAARNARQRLESKEGGSADRADEAAAKSVRR